MVVVTKVDGTIPTLGITTKEVVVGEATREEVEAAAVTGVVTAAEVGETKILATIASRVTVVGQQETNSMVATTVLRHTTWTKAVTAEAAVAVVVTAAATMAAVAKEAEEDDSKTHVSMNCSIAITKSQEFMNYS